MADLTSNDQRGTWAIPADPPRIVLANGINTHGRGNVDKLGHVLATKYAHKVIDVRLPKRHTISAWWGGRDDGQKIASYSRDGDILVCHSFGAVRGWYAHKYREYKAIICIAPAHGKNVEWYNGNRVWCYHSPADWIVWLGSKVPWHPFGKAGVAGYSQVGVHNINCRGADHDDYFKGDLLEEICTQIDLLARSNF